MKSSIIFSFFTLCIAFSTSAQKKVIDHSAYKNNFEDDRVVYLKNQESILIQNDTGIRITNTHFEDKLQLQEEAAGYLSNSIFYSESFNEILSKESYLLIPDRKRYKRKDIFEFEKESASGGNIFYDDNKRLIVKYPKTEEGTRAVLKYVEEIKDPHFLGAFYFTSYIPCLDGQFEITFPSNVAVGYKTFNNEENVIQFTEEKNGDLTTYRWKSENRSTIKFHSDAPSISYSEPHVVVFVENYEKDGETVQVLSGPKELYNWYQSLVQGVNAEEPTEELVQLVDSITSGSSTDREKVKDIFYWVQNNIKYIAFEDGLGGFIPRKANQVCSKRFGDCKDMASIITEMLEVAKIPSYLTWIGSRDIPYSYDELSTPNVDNHMIAAVKLDGEYLFLDATGQYSPLGQPTSFIQGKQALIGLSETEFDLYMVPVLSKEHSSIKDHNSLEIIDGKLIGLAEVEFTGYKKFRMGHKLFGKNNEQEQKFMKAYFEKGNNTFLLKEYKIKHLDNKEEALRVTANYEVSNYVKSFEDEIYVNLHLEKPYAHREIDTSEIKLPIEVDFKNTVTFINELKVPEGYTVDYLPKKEVVKNERFGFSIAYTEEDGKIILEKSIYVNTLMIEPADFEAWNEMIEQLKDAYGEAIALKKRSN